MTDTRRIHEMTDADWLEHEEADGIPFDLPRKQHIQERAQQLEYVFEKWAVLVCIGVLLGIVVGIVLVVIKGF